MGRSCEDAANAACNFTLLAVGGATTTAWREAALPAFPFLADVVAALPFGEAETLCVVFADLALDADVFAFLLGAVATCFFAVVVCAAPTLTTAVNTNTLTLFSPTTISTETPVLTVRCAVPRGPVRNALCRTTSDNPVS
jgi:hypothetical protein